MQDFHATLPKGPDVWRCENFFPTIHSICVNSPVIILTGQLHCWSMVSCGSPLTGQPYFRDAQRAKLSYSPLYF
jgi:hypothetical protein